MAQIIQMDSQVALKDQLHDTLPEKVYPVNIFHVPSGKTEQFIENWAISAKALNGRKGFISTQLHRGIAGSQTFMNLAVWETVAD